MDGKMVLHNLQEARKIVALGERHIAEQRVRIKKLTRDGYDVSQSLELLATFEATQRFHVEHVERLQSELDASKLGAVWGNHDQGDER